MLCRNPEWLPHIQGRRRLDELGNSPCRRVFVMRSRLKHAPIAARCGPADSAPMESFLAWRVLSNWGPVRFVGDVALFHFQEPSPDSALVPLHRHPPLQRRGEDPAPFILP
jgi:hypothetical protein